RDERHHSGQAGPQLVDRALDEHPSTVKEDDGPENRPYPPRTGEGRSLVAEQHLHVLGPEHDGESQRERQPEFVTEHTGGMSGVGIVSRVHMAAVVRIVFHVRTMVTVPPMVWSVMVVSVVVAHP